MSVSDDEYVSDVDSETESKDLESFDVVDFANSKCKVKKENVLEKIKLEPFSVLVQRKKRELAATAHPWAMILQRASCIPKLQLARQDVQVVANCQFTSEHRSLMFPLMATDSSQLFVPSEIISQIEAQISEWQQERQIPVNWLHYSFEKLNGNQTHLCQSTRNRIAQFQETQTDPHDFFVIEVGLNFLKDWKSTKISEIGKDYSLNLEIV